MLISTQRGRQDGSRTGSDDYDDNDNQSYSGSEAIEINISAQVLHKRRRRSDGR